MKKFTLLMAAAAVSFAAAAEVVTPAIFKEDFYEMGQKGDAVTGDWVTYGVSDPVADPFNAWFPNSDIHFKLVQYGSYMCALSPTTFTNGATADEWLVTPEIEMTEDNMTVAFSTCFYRYNGASASVPIAVYVSESGSAEKSAFDTENPLFNRGIGASSSEEIGIRNLVVPANGHKGKKVRFAFVQRGQNAGCFGFTNIVVGPYYCAFENLNPSVAKKGESINFSLNSYIKAPVTCRSATAQLFIDGVLYDEVQTTRNISPTNTGTVQPTAINFTKPYTIEKSIEYIIKVTPDYEGAPTSSFSGVIGVPEVTYLSNTVVEEVTASGCQACPMGIASMKYMEDNYKGGENEGKFIGIAIHGFINHEDPMSEGNEAYLSLLQSQAIGNTNYPAATFNRNVRGAYPYNLSHPRRQIVEGSNNKLEITAVEYPAADNTDDIIEKDLTVKFNAFNSFDAASLDLNAAAVMIENKVVGYNTNFNQTNGFYNRDQNYVLSAYGADASLILPYMKEFLHGGSMGKAEIPYTDMEYNHVSRGIFPDYYGTAVEGEWKTNVGKPISITFKVPATVSDFKNTEVIVLLIDNRSGAIVGSDIIPYEKYTATSAVGEIRDDAASISRVADEIHVTAPEGALINVFSVDGALLNQVKANGNVNVINGSDFQGLVIVSVNGMTRKMLF